MKTRILQFGLIVVLVAVAFLLRDGQRLPATPEQAISEFFDAARSGDVTRYLRLTTGDLRESLEQLREQQGAETFGADLRKTDDGIVGQAVREVSPESSGTAVYEVELVFEDRVESQTFRLQQLDGGWAIASIGEARTYQPEIPYGAPVASEPASGSSAGESAR